MVAPLEEMLRNSRLFDPMFVLVTFSAVPVVVVSVLTRPPVAPGLQGFSSHTFTVPPPVAVKPALLPVDSEIPPEKVIVVPVLFVREIPLLVPPESLIAPVKLLVSPVLLEMEINCPLESVMVPA